MKFLWCTGNAPGSTHDCAAFAATRLRAFLKEHGLFVRFLVFTWQNSVHPEVVERAFGMLVGLCLVLERPLRIPLFSVHSVVTACMRLQNVCIQQRQVAPTCNGVRGAGREPGTAERTYADQPPEVCLTGGEAAGAWFTAARRATSSKREEITAALRRFGIQRPPDATYRGS